MNMNKIDRDYYIVTEIREACIKNNWFTCGTNREYDEMFEMAKNAKPSDDLAVRNVIEAIWFATEDDMDEKNGLINDTVRDILAKAWGIYPEEEEMTREQAQAKVDTFNEELRNYKENEMLKELGVEEGKKLSANEWFSIWNKAYNLLEKYYNKGSLVQDACRVHGHDVKMNMQTYELTLY